MKFAIELFIQFVCWILYGICCLYIHDKYSSIFDNIYRFVFSIIKREQITAAILILICGMPFLFFVHFLKEKIIKIIYKD
jgi:hypothetical protein